MDLETLKAKCLKQNLDPLIHDRFRKSWAIYYAVYITHFFSIRMVWLLIRTPITPNQVTMVSFLVGGVAVFFFHYHDSFHLILGAAMFELFYILDAVDGQLARAKKISSRGGAFLDELGNFMVAPIILYSIGITHVSGPYASWISFSAAFSVLMILQVEHAYDRVLARRGEEASLYKENQVSAGPSFLKWTYILVYRSCTMPVIMNAVTAACILTIFNLSVLSPLVIYYAVIGMCVWMTKAYFIAFKKLS